MKAVNAARIANAATHELEFALTQGHGEAVNAAIRAEIARRRGPVEDDATSHLKNALQVSVLLAAELPKMIGNPGYLDDATKGLTAIDERIRAALALIERKPLRCTRCTSNTMKPVGPRRWKCACGEEYTEP